MYGDNEPEEETNFLKVPSWQRLILDERLADLDQHPEDEESWEEVKAQLWPHLAEGSPEGV